MRCTTYRYNKVLRNHHRELTRKLIDQLLCQRLDHAAATTKLRHRARQGGIRNDLYQRLIGFLRQLYVDKRLSPTSTLGVRARGIDFGVMCKRIKRFSDLKGAAEYTESSDGGGEEEE